jgi:serine/threonine-protein kinase
MAGGGEKNSENAAAQPGANTAAASGANSAVNSTSNRNVLKELGGFELIEKVGQGGMGSVFKARQKSLDRIVALKVLPASIAKNATFIDRFQREARASAKLSHPNVVQGIDVGCDSATQLWYFAMEFIDGPNMRQTLKEQKVIPERRALEIVRDVAKALEAIAAAGIVHRDIKPDNILITRTGVVKLADLGLATQANVEDATLTQSGQTIGTPYYMAPEQVRGLKDKIDIRSDIYALGATLFHLVTGQRPFTGNTNAEIMSRHLTDPVPKASDINPDVSPGCTKLIFRMMAKTIEQRVQTPKELLDLIEQTLNPASKTGPRSAVRTTGPRAPIQTTGPRAAVTGTGRLQPVQPAAKSRPMLTVISVVLMIGIVTAVVFSISGSNSGSKNAASANPPSPSPAPAPKSADAAPVKPANSESPEHPATAAPTAATETKDTTAVPAIAIGKPDKTEAAKLLDAGPKPPAIVAAPPANETVVAKADLPNQKSPVTDVTIGPAPPPGKEAAKPLPPPEAALELNRNVARAAMQKFTDEFLTLLSQGNRKAAGDAVDHADTDEALAPLRDQLKLSRAMLGWLGELDHAVESGAMKVTPTEGFELRSAAGGGWTIGGKDGFSISGVKDGTITIASQGASVPVPISKLSAATYRKLAERGMGEDANALTRLAFLDILELRAQKKADPATLTAAKSALDKAKASGAPDDQTLFLADALTEAGKAQAESAAQASWEDIQKLAAGKQHKPLVAALDAFEKQHGATAFAKDKAAEIAEFRQSTIQAEMVMAGLVLWLHGDAGINANNGKVRSWEDQSGKNHVAVQHKGPEQPTVVPEGFNGKPAIHFDGNSQFLTIKDVGPFKSYTILWTIKPMDVRNFNQQMGAWGQFAFTASGDGSAFVGTSMASRMGPAEGLKAGTVTKGVWQQFTYVLDNGKGSFYKNGKLLGTRKIDLSNWKDFQLGAPDKNTINGDVSELAIYDRALPDTERQSVEKHMFTEPPSPKK